MTIFGLTSRNCCWLAAGWSLAVAGCAAEPMQVGQAWTDSSAAPSDGSTTGGSRESSDDDTTPGESSASGADSDAPGPWDEPEQDGCAHLSRRTETCNADDLCCSGRCDLPIFEECTCSDRSRPCSEDSDCCTPYSCWGGQCDCRESGQSCRDERDCCAGQCVDEVCQPPGLEERCQNYSIGQCAEGLFCYGSTCRQGAGASCVGGDQCVSNECVGGSCACSDNQCFNDSQCCNGTPCVNDSRCCWPPQSPCTDPSDCCSRRCTSGRCGCIEPGEFHCETDADCCEGTCEDSEPGRSRRCSGGGGTCVQLGMECGAETACCSGLGCVGVVCCGSPDYACDANYECCSGSCINGACQCSDAGQACGSDAQCCAGLTCLGASEGVVGACG